MTPSWITDEFIEEARKIQHLIEPAVGMLIQERMPPYRSVPYELGIVVAVYPEERQLRYSEIDRVSSLFCAFDNIEYLLPSLDWLVETLKEAGARQIIFLETQKPCEYDELLAVWGIEVGKPIHVAIINGNRPLACIRALVKITEGECESS